MPETKMFFPNYSGRVEFRVTQDGSAVDLTDTPGGAVTKVGIEFYRKSPMDSPTDSFDSTTNASNFDVSDALLLLGKIVFKYTSSDFDVSTYIPTIKQWATSQVRLVLFVDDASEGEPQDLLQARFER